MSYTNSKDSFRVRRYVEFQFDPLWQWNDNDGARFIQSLLPAILSSIEQSPADFTSLSGFQIESGDGDNPAQR